MNKALKKYVALIEKDGMHLEAGGKHYSVLHNGKRVGTVSTTGETNALRQSIRDLARQGLFKDEKQARSVKF